MKLHLRAAWNALRGYAAAQENRASTWSPSGGSANGEVGMAAASVARRARDAVRNDPYAARIVDLWTGNAVGAGITTRWPETAQGRIAGMRITDSPIPGRQAWIRRMPIMFPSAMQRRQSQ